MKYVLLHKSVSIKRKTYKEVLILPLQRKKFKPQLGSTGKSLADYNSDDLTYRCQRVKSLHDFEGKMHELHQSHNRDIYRLKRHLESSQKREEIHRNENSAFTLGGPSRDSNHKTLFMQSGIKGRELQGCDTA